MLLVSLTGLFEILQTLLQIMLTIDPHCELVQTVLVLGLLLLFPFQTVGSLAVQLQRCRLRAHRHSVVQLIWIFTLPKIFNAIFDFQPRKSFEPKKRTMGMKTRTGGQMSVLELLELQARARAIRSQLAMEPITKIEVKSDDDDENPAEKVQRKEKRSTKNKESGKRKSQETKATREDTSHPPAEADSTSKEQQAPRKKIKIKRNYRQTSKSPDKEAAAPPPPSETSVTIKDTSKPSRSNSRSASPDVITIQMEPETLLISDSTDDEATKQKSKKTTEPVVVEPPAPVVESEPEEGEVRDEPEEPAKSEEQAEPEGPANTEELTQPEEPEKNIEPTKKEAPKTSDEPEKCTEKKKLSEEASLAIHNPPAEAKQSTISEPATLDDEDQNDDVISIGGDLEMIEEMTKEDEPLPVSIKNEKKEKLPDPEDMDNDVISLDTSEDERDKLQRTDSESWRTRYMKSSKVSQVLAESRLGKRVRDKLKKSKRSKVAASDEQAEAEKQPVSFTSKHEDGSIEQYQELLQHRQRKTSSSSKGDK
ncbi:hypothetical protein M5D96_005231 [Drosophila gunungcola]|uniref:Uncharacterized protein n=1 Tax=Drosophila gunungcola TaxID=103775 RepID=A0A9Q0BQG9_9MUSC|nr:hypothetical protein M5D96_005231 [Drosophila gunungcola]